MEEGKSTKEMFIITTPCWSCERDMLVALVGNESGLDYGPESFSELEKKLAEKNGVLLKTVSSRTAEETYLANFCGNCGQFVGKFFFFGRYFAPALYGDLKYQKLSL